MTDTPNNWNSGPGAGWPTGPASQPPRSAPPTPASNPTPFSPGSSAPTAWQTAPGTLGGSVLGRPTGAYPVGSSAGGFSSAPNTTATLPPSQETQRPRKAGKVTAAVLGIILLAGTVGAGSAAITTSYLSGKAAAPAVATGGGNSPAVVKQANPNSPDWTTVAAATSKSVVAIQALRGESGGRGSGVVIDGSGNIVTNNHVVNGAEQLLVLFEDQTYSAKLVGTDPATDLAVIRLTDPPTDLQPIAWGDGNALKVGDPVLAIGNPLGLSDTVTNGIVSALDRPVTTEVVDSERQTNVSASEQSVVTAAIQTNAAINPGNSGGALLNSSGELVGITSSIATLSGDGRNKSGSIGIGFAIGSNQAKHVAEQLIANGKATYPLIGVSAHDLNKVGQLGAEVERVAPDSPAQSVGLRPGDVITQIAGRQVSSTIQLIGLVRAQRPGDTVSLGFTRDGKQQEVQIEMKPAQQ